MERKNVSIRTYKRKSQIWFGTEADSFSYDFVWHLPLQMYLDGDILSFKREGNIPIFLNHQIVNEEKISIKNGDQIQIEEFMITFFKEKLEVQADTECFETTLLPERQEEEYFEGFPFYKRSPKGPYQIARELSEEKIERPSYYLGKKGLGNHASNYDKENPYMWRGNQVTTLIARPEYIGKTVNFRTFKNSYKDKKTKRADKEDWVVFDDTQEPIVDEETWLLAQKLRQNVRKADPMGEPNVLTGKIYCADCGAPMYNHRQRKGRERIYYTAKGEKRTSYSNPADCYECSTYNLAYQKYDRHCTCHHISTKALKSIILKTIQETCHYVSLNEREFVYSLQEESAMKDIAVSETVKKRIERNQKRVHELDMLIRKIYEDNVIGRLPDRLFQSMLTDYENEQNELNKIIETDTADMQRIIGGQNNVERFLKLVKKYENITELTPAMINEFIDKILVHEPQGKGADRTTEVEIYLNYVGQFQVPVEQHEPTEEERIAAEKEAERLRRKRESNRKYMKKIREKSKKFAEHERIAEENNSDSKLCAEQNATSKSNRQKVKGEKIA